jgi:hypothetical protein
MPLSYTLANSGYEVTPAKGEVNWKPVSHWGQYPVRISELVGNDEDFYDKPFGFGYLYDVNGNMTNVKIHCVTEMVPKYVTAYKETVYSTLSEYFAAFVSGTPDAPRQIEDFIELQLGDGEWISFKTYVRFVVGDPIRYFTPSEKHTTPRENAVPVAFPGGGSIPEEEPLPPPLRMGANGVVARSISSNPIDYEEEEEVEEFMTPPSQPSTSSPYTMPVLLAEERRIVFPEAGQFWAPERDAHYQRIGALWMKYLYENGQKPSRQDQHIWGFVSSRDAEYMLDNEIRRISRKSQEKDHYRPSACGGPIPRSYTEASYDNIGTQYPIRLSTDSDGENAHVGIIERIGVEENPITKTSYYSYMITLDAAINVNGTDISSFDSIYQYVEEGKENRFIDCWKNCEVFYDGRWQLADDVRRDVF